MNVDERQLPQSVAGDVGMTRREGVVFWTIVGAVLLVLVVVVLALPAVLLIGGHQTVTSNIGNPSP